MQIKDRIVTWYIQNIILPRREIIDNPGFLITAFTDKKHVTYLRDLLLPEKLFEEIESTIASAYGDQGQQVLYSAGKKFGYIYSSMSNLPTINTSTNKELEDFAYLMLRFVEGTYAKQANHEVDFEKKTLQILFDNYIICRHNGLGYIMTNGSLAGLWAYIVQDNTVEGIQLKCQGRGDDNCHILCAPEKTIQEKIHRYYRENEMNIHKSESMYKALNEIRPTRSTNSLKRLLDAGFFKFSHGVFSYKDMRFFLCDSHILYFLEQEISKLKNGEEVLFDVCFEYGKFLQQIYGGKDFQKFIPDFFPALGFGDIIILDPHKPRLASMYYPWSVYSKDSKYIIFRGIMSGFISSSLEKEIKFTKYTMDIRTCLTLTIDI